MTGKQLKNSILQWAIQGKLVPQDPNDEPASVLLERIRAEKAQLIKEGKIKKDKNESIIYRGDDNSYYEKIVATGEVKCIDEEIPFAIPKGWEWTRLGNVAELIGGYAFKSESLKGRSGTRVIRISDISESGFVNKNIVRYCGASVSDSFKIQNGDILIAMTGGTVGKSMYITNTPEVLLLNQRVAAIRCSYLNTDYLDVVIKSPLVQDVVNDKKNSTNDNISMGDIYNFLIPVPPYQQQFRIILQYQKLVPFILRYKNSQEALDQLNNNISALLKKSILQEAIQGKLVPQNPSYEPASELLKHIREEKFRLVKEGKLKKKDITDSVIFRDDDNKYYENNSGKISCIDDEIPFEIPSNWAWVRLDNICSFIHRGKSPKYSLVKKYPVIAQKCNQWSGFSIEKARFIEPNSLSSYKDDFFLQDKDLMWNSTGLGTLGRMAIYYTALNPYELAVADSHVTIIRPLKQYIVPEFLYYYFASNTVQSVVEEKSDGSTKQKELATKTIQAYLVPLPPFAEQYRIVQQIKSVTSIMSR